MGADERLVAAALERLGEDGEVIALDPSADRLEQLRGACRDPRVWFLIGDAGVIPLPDASVDAVVGHVPSEAAPERSRVLRKKRRS